MSKNGCAGSSYGDPPIYNPPHWAPYCPPYYPPRETSAAPHTIHVVPSIQEQMGIDPISKLAAAIEKLADALAKGQSQ